MRYVHGTRQPLRSGTQIEKGRYVIKKVLGQGGFAVTYLAEDKYFRCDVAIKEYLPEDPSLFNWPTGREWFLEEARNLYTISHGSHKSHPNIVVVNNYFDDKGQETAFIVMKHIDGISLRAYLEQHGVKRRNRALRMKQMWPILRGLLSALQHLHNCGIVHADITLNNILILKDGTPVLIDFGAARKLIQGQTRSGNPSPKAGTDGFAPPEHYMSRSKTEVRNDIYGAGAVLYACIAGKPPPTAWERVELDRYTPAATVGRHRYTRAFLAAIDRALEFDPNRRPHSIAEFERELLRRPLWQRLVATGVLAALVAGAAAGAYEAINHYTHLRKAVNITLDERNKERMRGDSLAKDLQRRNLELETLKMSERELRAEIQARRREIGKLEREIAQQLRDQRTIQVGAYPTEAEARRRLEEVRAKAADVLSMARTLVQSVAARNGRQLYRARFSGFDAASAASACKSLNELKIECHVPTDG